jgi:hypothetical protein
MPVIKRTLEVNPTHPVIARRREVHAAIRRRSAGARRS